MHIVKPIIYTVLYLAFIELIGAWIFIADYFEGEFLADDYYYFINGLIMAAVLITFTFFITIENLNYRNRLHLDGMD